MTWKRAAQTLRELGGMRQKFRFSAAGPPTSTHPRPFLSVCHRGNISRGLPRRMTASKGLKLEWRGGDPENIPVQLKDIDTRWQCLSATYYKEVETLQLESLLIRKRFGQSSSFAEYFDDPPFFYRDRGRFETTGAESHPTTRREFHHLF